MCDKRFPCGTQIITSDIEKIDRTAEKELTAITTGGSTYILPINNCIDVRAEYCGQNVSSSFDFLFTFEKGAIGAFFMDIII